MENHVDALIQQTKDAHPDVRRQSAIELGTSDNSVAREEAIQALVTLLGDEHIAVRETAEEALVEIGGQKVVQAMTPCLEDPSTTVVNYTIEILSRIGDDAIDLILSLLESKDHDIRKFGCDILGNLRYTEAVYDLIELLNDPHVNVAIAAGEALGKLRHLETVPHLIRALHHPDTWMKCIAAEALGKIGDSRAVDPFIAMSDYEDPIVLYTVIKAMGNLVDQRVLPYILSVLRSNPMFVSSAVQAIEHLAELQGGTIYEGVQRAGVGHLFVGLLKSENPDVLRSAINLVGHLQLREAIHPLGHLLEHKHETIVVEATNALVRIGEPELEEIHSVFDQLFSSLQPDVLEYETEEPKTEPLVPFTRLSIIKVLGEIGSQKSLTLLIRALDDTVADEIRVEAASALGKILGTAMLIPADQSVPIDVVVASALDRLIATLSDSCDALRMSAAEALGESGFRGAFRPLMTLLQEQSIDVREAASIALSKIRYLSLEEKLLPIRQLLERSALNRDEESGDKESKDEGTELSLLSDGVRASVVRTLYRIAGEREAESVKTFLDDPSYEVRVATLEAIRNFSGDVPSLSRLHILILPLLQDAEFQVRIAAIQALTEWGTQQLAAQHNQDRIPQEHADCSSDLYFSIIDSLVTMLSDPHPRVQYEICRQLTEVVATLGLEAGTAETIVDMLIQLVHQQDVMVKIAAVEALTALRSATQATIKAVPVLRRLLLQTTELEMKDVLHQALSVIRIED